MNNLMIDLETMGTRPTSAIVSIGAVFFDERGLGEKFYCAVNLESAMSYGLTVDGSTIMWWLKQSDEACKALDTKRTLDDALEDFTDYFLSFGGKDTNVWGNGSDFDNVLLSNAYRAVGSQQPWSYWNNRCYRTMKSLAPSIKHERKGTHHNALDDAIYQAEHLRKLLGWLK